MAGQESISRLGAGNRINMPARHGSCGNFGFPLDVPDVPREVTTENRGSSIVAELATIVVVAIDDASVVAGRSVPERRSIW